MIFDFISSGFLRFTPASLSENLSQVPNPGRGWYQIFTFHVPQPSDFNELFWCLRKDETLAMAVVDIGAYKNKPLDSPAMQLITQILDFFQQNEKDLILRFVYDCEGNGLLHEPALFSLIEEHIQQLTPVLCAYTKTVFVLQGMFLGSWGEMHGSKFLTPMHLKKLGERMKAAAGTYTWLAVRKPSQWRVLHGTDGDHGQMGLFNDGIFGSDTDLGTFGSQSRAQAFWEDPWCAQDELAFEEMLCRKVPHGGEVVCPQENPDLTDTEILHKLRRMHITYLNCVHDLRLLDTWKQKKSPWPNVSLYDYVGAHLGYRFLLRAVKLQKKKRQLQLEVTVENTGFAPCYEECSVTVEIMAGERMLRQETQWDLRTVMAGTQQKWNCVLPDEKGKLFLTVRRKKDGRSLNFCNAGQEQGKLYLGCIE